MAGCGMNVRALTLEHFSCRWLPVCTMAKPLPDGCCLALVVPVAVRRPRHCQVEKRNAQSSPLQRQRKPQLVSRSLSFPLFRCLSLSRVRARALAFLLAFVHESAPRLSSVHSPPRSLSPALFEAQTRARALTHIHTSRLSLARLFLFGSRDMWFEVPLPFYLRSPPCPAVDLACDSPSVICPEGTFCGFPNSTYALGYIDRFRV